MVFMQISLSEARQMVLQAQLLDNHTNLPAGKEGVQQVIDRLGYIQIDTINVIERAHHHTLFTRVEDYHPSVLDELLTADRAIFEYWGHAMSYLPMKDYRYYLQRMQNFYNPQGKWAQAQMDAAGHLLETVRARIKSEGSLSAKDFKSEKKEGGTWWDWKPAKIALEFLFWRGELMISERRKFQKVYDLTERVLPGTIDTSIPDTNETAYYVVRRALRAMGIATRKEIHKFLQPGNDRDSDLQAVEKKEINRVIQELLESNELVSIKIDTLSEYEYFCFNRLLEDFVPEQQGDQSIHILSPFDNLIIQRERIGQLFNFNYVLECYMPQAKRKFGYFVLPILLGNTFIGRMDCKANRQQKMLEIISMSFEDSFISDKQTLTKLAAKLKLFAHFNGCNSVHPAADISKKFRDVIGSME